MPTQTETAKRELLVYFFRFLELRVVTRRPMKRGSYGMEMIRFHLKRCGPKSFVAQLRNRKV